MEFKHFLIFILLIQLIGCAKDVVYDKPVVESAAAFKELGSWVEVNSSQELIKNDWWRLFNDQTLDQLESKIDDSNPNLSAFLARLEQSRAYTLTLSSQSTPNVNAIAQATNNRQSDHRPLRGGSQPDVYGTNTLGLSIDYDLDLWGRIKGLVSSGKSLESRACPILLMLEWVCRLSWRLIILSCGDLMLRFCYISKQYSRMKSN